MRHNVHSALEKFLIPLDKLDPLPGNPRKGDVDAIAASYDKFGQVRPIVVTETAEGRYTIVAGNHQFQAAKKLGWTHIAAVASIEQADAVSFALTDNRLSELGHSDEELTLKMLKEVIDQDQGFFDVLGWDDFEIAAMETSTDDMSNLGTRQDPHKGWTPPNLVERPEGDYKWEGGNERDVATHGISTFGDRARFQYQIVFDDAEQQKVWYSFLRWLKMHFTEGTTGQQLTEFFTDILEGRWDWA